MIEITIPLGEILKWSGPIMIFIFGGFMLIGGLYTIYRDNGNPDYFLLVFGSVLLIIAIGTILSILGIVVYKVI